MTTNVIAVRDKALARHDRALERWPDRTGSGFARELSAIAGDLEHAASALDAEGADSVERSRSWRFVGDALFDLARGAEPATLKRAAAAYAHAEQLLEAFDAPVERAKLDFNYANTLRGLSAGTERALLEEAQLRYLMALTTLQRASPQHAPTVQAAFDSLQLQLTALGAFEQGQSALDSLRRAADALARTPDNADAQAKARQLLDEMKARRATVLGEVTRAVQDFGAHQPASAAERLGALIDQLQTAAGAPNDPFQRLFPVLLARVRSEIDAGHVTPERQAALEPILIELQDLITQPEGELDAQVGRMGRLRELITRMIKLLAAPSTGAPPPQPGSRAEHVSKFEGGLAQFLSAEQLRPNQGSAEREVGRALFEQLAKARMTLSAAGADDERVVAYERDVLRPLAQQIEQYALRHHLTLAQPFWAVPAEPADPGSIYFANASALRVLVAEIAKARALRIVEPRAGADVGQARWNAIWASRVSLFDLRTTTGVELAAACYELGLAKALGRHAVIVVAPDTVLPFDVEVSPVVLAGDATDRGVLALALENAFYLPPHREADSSLAETVAEVAERYGTAPAFETRKSAELVQQAADDPIEARRRIESLLGFLGPESPRVLFPAWPGGYSARDGQRLFHVMPFSLPWSDVVRDMAAAACRRKGVHYVRGDEVPDPRVIRSIWDEICRASHVLLDLTGFNANVALEMGLVHGLGRRCLAVAQDDAVKHLFPAIRKVRVLPYSLAEGGRTLAGAIETFVASSGSV